jgi:type VI secretion system secreted protein Hcp
MAADIFLEIKGIKGEARDKVHSGKIDVLAWSWGVSNSGSAHVGGGQGAGKANVQDISITKYIDKSSTALLESVSLGKHFPDATLIVRKAGGKPLEYFTIKMTDVMVTSYQTGGSGGEDRLTESLTLTFAKVNTKYIPQKADGNADGETTFAYDIAANAQA